MVCLLAAGVAGACTAGPPATRPPSATSARPAAESRADVAGEKAINVYLGMWHSMANAALTSDWKSPLLAKHATGHALNTISRGLYADHQNGLVTKGTPKNDPAVAAVEPPDDPVKVTINDCGDSTNWLKYRADTGRRADDGPGGRRAITAVVGRKSGGFWRASDWLVSDFAIQAVGTC